MKPDPSKARNPPVRVPIAFGNPMPASRGRVRMILPCPDRSRTSPWMTRASVCAPVSPFFFIANGLDEWQRRFT